MKAPRRCQDCGELGHNSARCVAPDREKAERVRAVEAEAIQAIAALLVGKVDRPRWIGVLSLALGAAHRGEESAQREVFKSERERLQQLLEGMQ